MKTRLYDNREPILFYLRTEKGVEIDLIMKKEGLLYPYEIKSSMTPNKDFSKNMKVFCNSEANSGEMTVIYCGENYESFENYRYINYTFLAETLT